jgi:hypothetical protein
VELSRRPYLNLVGIRCPTSGIVATGEEETGDTATSGDSDVYAVFYVEDHTVYVESRWRSTPQPVARSITGIELDHLHQRRQ